MRDHQWEVWLSQLRSRLGNLVELGEIRHSRGGMVRYRYLRRFALILITRGEGIYEDERGRQRSLAAGDWVLVLPELGHSYRPLVPGGWDEVYAVFEGPVFETWRRAGVLDPGRPSGRVDDLAGLVRRLRTEVVASGAGPIERLCAFQRILAGVVEGGVPPSLSTSSGPPWLADACRLLARPGARLTEVAAELGMPADTFRRAFRRHAGQPPHRYHLQQIVNQAASLLDSTRMKSADIAGVLGFHDEAHFSRVFKRITGRPPRDYRRRRDAGTK